MQHNWRAYRAYPPAIPLFEFHRWSTRDSHRRLSTASLIFVRSPPLCRVPPSPWDPVGSRLTLHLRQQLLIFSDIFGLESNNRSHCFYRLSAIASLKL